jgi:hypothetical protein
VGQRGAALSRKRWVSVVILLHAERRRSLLGSILGGFRRWVFAFTCGIAM